jgi:hypothetical protein
MSIVLADSVTFDADAEIGPLIRSVEGPLNSLSPVALDPCILTFDPSS